MSAPALSPFESQAPPRRILVVDDAPIFREIETVFLRRAGTVITANDGTSGFETALRERPDLVVTDLVMRELDGDALCRRLREDPDLRNTPVLIVTSGRAPDEHERAVRAGADDVIEKPIKRISLLQAVNRLLRDRTRSLPRAEFDAEVTLCDAAGERTGRALNVSRGGLFVETSDPWEPDTEIELSFATPDGKRRFEPTARVAWRRAQVPGLPTGMGLQFLKLAPEAISWLDDYVYEFSTPVSRGEGLPAPTVPG